MAEFADPDQGITREELQLATRNRGMPLEGLRYPITPVGMHYLLIHFDIPDTNEDDWTLEVGGAVTRELSLSISDLRDRPATTLPVTLECAGNGRALLEPRPMSQPWLVEAIGTAEWTGTPLAPILDEAGLADDTRDIVFTGADRGFQGGREQDYQRALSPEEAAGEDVLLAYAMNGRPLEPQHGHPLRLIVPGWYGMTHVKWLRRIEAVVEPFDGYQHESYRYKQTEHDEGDPVERIRVRALMAPPGAPDFFTRTRVADEGLIRLSGRAWSGAAPVERVEVAVDGVWRDAVLDDPIGRWAWRGWSFPWHAEPGDHELACRATDSTGATQPDAPPWNMNGMGNNMVQTISVTVRAR